jgi:hypothetical protein
MELIVDRAQDVRPARTMQASTVLHVWLRGRADRRQSPAPRHQGEQCREAAAAFIASHSLVSTPTCVPGHRQPPPRSAAAQAGRRKYEGTGGGRGFQSHRTFRAVRSACCSVRAVRPPFACPVAKLKGCPTCGPRRGLFEVRACMAARKGADSSDSAA